MPADVGALLAELDQETALLVEMVEESDDSVWSRDTPAEGWTIRDQFTHLAYFDDATVQAAVDPDGFSQAKDEAIRNADSVTGSVASRFAAMPGEEALAWFRRARRPLMRVYSQVDPAARIPWYGPDMSPASAVTARIMETWAHGQDILDALGMRRQESPGLRQVAHLGVRTLGNSFLSHGRQVPETPVRVELTAPGGDVWVWGPESAADSISGPAVDFCLVVTQRRHPADTDLVAHGSVAQEWLTIAQAFAGPPGPGRHPGQSFGPAQGGGVGRR